jgi:molybdopterin-guanine dinucleotide biosynthesis protein A
MTQMHTVTGLLLAGGRGSRMGGSDKGLQPFQGTPLALHALFRLQLQVGHVLISANRNLAAYESLGAPVLPDALPDFAGPLAGFLAGLQACETDYLLTVPCDTPRFPMDLAARLLDALERQDAEIAMPSVPETDGRLWPQPVFCLMKAELLSSLSDFTQGGGRKIDAWTARHRCVSVPFNEPADDPQAFFNANTLAELRQLERR